MVFLWHHDINELIQKISLKKEVHISLSFEEKTLDKAIARGLNSLKAKNCEGMFTLYYIEPYIGSHMDFIIESLYYFDMELIELIKIF